MGCPFETWYLRVAAQWLTGSVTIWPQMFKATLNNKNYNKAELKYRLYKTCSDVILKSHILETVMKTSIEFCVPLNISNIVYMTDI